MATTTIWRTQATETITVSTVHVREGRTSWYETALIVGGRVSEPRRQDRKSRAGIEHDYACALVRGWETAPDLRMHYYVKAFAEIAG